MMTCESNNMPFYKVVVVGAKWAGKTALSTRLAGGEFPQETPYSPPLDLFIPNQTVFYHTEENKKIECKLGIWDVGGDFESVNDRQKECFEAVDAFIICVDAADEMSEQLKQLSTYLSFCKEQDDTSKIIFVRTKSDFKSTFVSSDEAFQFAMEEGIPYFETSAKNNIDIEALYEYIVNELTNNLPKRLLTHGEHKGKVSVVDRLAQHADQQNCNQPEPQSTVRAAARGVALWWVLGALL